MAALLRIVIAIPLGLFVFASVLLALMGLIISTFFLGVCLIPFGLVVLISFWLSEQTAIGTQP